MGDKTRRFNVAAPLLMEVETGIPGLDTIILKVRKPSPMEGSHMMRALNEMRLQMGVILEIKKDTEQEKAQQLHEIATLRSSFEMQQAEMCVEKFIVGFEDKKDGEYIMWKDDTPIRSENKSDWAEILFNLIPSHLYTIWRNLLDIHTGDAGSVKFSEHLSKNSQPVSEFTQPA